MNRLWVRLTIIFLVVALLAVGVVSIAVGRITSASFQGYVGEETAETMAHRLEDYYAATGSWEGAEGILLEQSGGGMGRGYIHGMSQEIQHGGGQRMGNRNLRFLLADAEGRIVADTREEAIGSMMSEAQQTLATPLNVGGETVGGLVAETPGAVLLTATQQRFLEDVTVGLRLAVGGAVVLAIVAGGVFAWQLARPLRRLTLAARQMAAGEIGGQVTLPMGSFREVADLAEAFNNMSRSLAEGEDLRRRMATDIAHELRTPVSVMRGQLEGMMDEVLPTDVANIAIAYNQALHLARLVDDLRTLTLAETGHLPLTPETIVPSELIEQVIQSFLPAVQDAGIRIEEHIAPDLSTIQADADRIRQVLSNLITNALRHTGARGQITVHSEEINQNIRVSVSNSGSTLTPEQARHVFERFWRADDARERDRGGAGLGLAISRELIHLHGGRIWVEAGDDVTTFSFEIPIIPTQGQSGGGGSSSADLSG